MKSTKLDGRIYKSDINNFLQTCAYNCDIKSSIIHSSGHKSNRDSTHVISHAE